MPMVGVPGGRTDRVNADWQKGGWVLLYQKDDQRVDGSPLFGSQQEAESWRDFKGVTEPTWIDFRQN